jgi:glutathione synthase/RimK-type ligase-like ATP-grasp enzyme
MKRVALVTYQGCLDLSEDDQKLLLPLRDRSLLGVPVSWDDPDIDWQEFAAIILRSTWDYPERQTEFMRWLERLETLDLPVWNDPALVRWNLDKRYLLDLEQRGFTIPYTVLIPRGDVTGLSAALEQWRWEKGVLKPTISNAGTGIATVDATRNEIPEPVLELVQTRDVLMQEFIPEILAEGEWSLVFVEGTFSHAVSKRPGRDDFRVHARWGGTTISAAPPPAALAHTQRLIESLSPCPLYARVDGVLQGEDFILMELELVEPSLVLLYDSSAADRFAQAIASRVWAAAV